MTFYDVNAAIDRPNIVNSLRQGFVFGQQQREMKQQEEDRNALRELTPRALAGDFGAQDQMAAIDPHRAQQTQQLGQDRWGKLKGAYDLIERARATGDVRQVNAALRATAPFFSSVTGKPAPTEWSDDPAFTEGWMQMGAMVNANAGPQTKDIPADVQSFEYFAGQAGLTPGTPEYAEAAARYGKLVEEQAKDPNSFREWQLAQENPEYAAHLAAGRAARQGPTITVQNPALSLSYDDEGRPIVGFGDGVSRPTATKVEQNIINARRQLDTLRRAGDTVADEYLTYEGRARGLAGRVMDKAGMTNDTVDFAASQSAALQNVEQFFNQYRKEITGAAAAQQELEALKKATVNSSLGPTEFKRRYVALMNQIESGLRADVETLGGQVADAPTANTPPAIPTPDRRVTDNTRAKSRYGF